MEQADKEEPSAAKRARTDMDNPAPSSDQAAGYPAPQSQAEAPRLVSPEDSAEDFDRWVVRALQSTAKEPPSAEDSSELPPEFRGFSFTGSLRPGIVSAQMPPPEGCSCLPDYALHPRGLPRSEFLRSRTKTIPVIEGEDLQTMRRACELGREVLDIAARFMRAGVTGDEIDRVVYAACRERRLYPSPLNYMGFPKSVCVSANEVICHGIPDSRPLQEGDIVNLDVSVCHEGFHADLNETYFIGQCDEESHHLVRSTYDALKASVALIRPGTLYRQLGGVIEAEAVKRGCSVVTAFCGHGVGRLFHGPPDIPHFKKNKTVGVMKPGHIFTVEPMLNLGKSRERLWPDGWTAATRDGRRSAQFEHTFLVTEEGVEVLTARVGTDRSSMPDYDPAAFQR